LVEWQVIAIQVLPGDVVGSANYQFAQAVDGEQLIFQLHHNQTSDRWYMTVRFADNSILFAGAKLVTGAYLGRRRAHPFMLRGVFVVCDRTRQGSPATWETLGREVAVRWYSQEEVAAELGFADGFSG
jgi:hypothetical protein